VKIQHKIEGIGLRSGRNLSGVKRIKFLRERRRGSAVKKWERERGKVL